MTRKIHFYQWPNLIALDAALIAVAWQVTLARALEVSLAAPAYIVLGLSVWLTYMADRLFDVASRSEDSLRSLRHQFTKRYKGTLWRIWWSVLMVNLVFATQLSATQLKRGLVLLAFCLLYTWLNQRLSRRFFPKEIFVAFIYSGGVVLFLPTAASTSFFVFFALLCLLNCLIIGAKEKAIDAQMQVHSIAPIIAERWLALSALSLHLLVILVAPTGAIAMSVSFLALGVLHLLRRRLSAESFRILADTALLLPPCVGLMV